MSRHRTGVLTFAEAVGTAHTPEPRAAGFATPESALGLGADVSEPRGRRRDYSTCAGSEEGTIPRAQDLFHTLRHGCAHCGSAQFRRGSDDE